eukprot:scaffold20040_cov60-Phaeocystis_antarctica.AAC.2
MAAACHSTLSHLYPAWVGQHAMCIAPWGRAAVSVTEHGGVGFRGGKKSSKDATRPPSSPSAQTSQRSARA